MSDSSASKAAPRSAHKPKSNHAALMQTADLAAAVRTVLILALVGSALGLILAQIFDDKAGTIISSICLMALIPLWHMFERGKVFGSALGLVILLDVLTFYALLEGGGIQDPSVVLFPVVVVVSGVLLDRRVFLAVSSLVLLSCSLVGVLELTGVVETRLGHLLVVSDVVFTVFLLSLVVGVVDVLSKAVRESTQRRLHSEQSYREMFNATGEGVLLVDPSTREIVDVNRAALSMFGVEQRSEMTLERLVAGSDGLDRDGLAEQLAGVTQGALHLEWSLPRDGGRSLWLEMSAHAGTIQGQERVICILRDVSERRELRRQVQLSERLQSVGLLARGVAHDFNNQLTGIMANSSLLQSELPSGGRLADYNDAIMACSQRSADLTQQLLAFAREGQRQSQVLDLDELVEDVCSLLRRSIDKKVQVVHVPSERPLRVLGDPSFLQNAVLNLGLNARDAMPEGGELRFEVVQDEQDDAWGVLRVSDTGVGIPQELLDRIYDPFFTTKCDGNGMGLAAVYGTMQTHGGSVRVSSELGCGTTFELRFPLTTAVPAAQGKDETSDSRIFSGLKVLLAEDEEKVAEVTVEILRDLGCEVTVCPDGSEAILHLENDREEFEVALLDHNMPRVSGAEVLEVIRKNHPELPVISTSGYAEATPGRVLRPDAFLSKPFTKKQLTDALRKVRGVRSPSTG